MISYRGTPVDTDGHPRTENRCRVPLPPPYLARCPGLSGTRMDTGRHAIAGTPSLPQRGFTDHARPHAEAKDHMLSPHSEGAKAFAGRSGGLMGRAGFSDIRVQVVTRPDTDGRLLPMIKNMAEYARGSGKINDADVEKILLPLRGLCQTEPTWPWRHSLS